MWVNGYRPTCYICGKFVGEGGYYDIVWDSYNGGYEEGYSTCKKHTNKSHTKNAKIKG
jgi:hypothetical protein